MAERLGIECARDVEASAPGPPLRGRWIGVGPWGKVLGSPYLQVLGTYVHRLRFWICGIVWLVGWTLRQGVRPEMVAASSTPFSCVLASFVALHLRRQFGAPLAHLAPNFAAPHLLVGGVVGLAVWCLAPAAEAAARGISVVGMLSIHATAGLLLALVAIWPKSVVLVAAAPALALALKSKTFVWIASGESPVLGGVLIATVVLFQVVAARTLLRLSDQGQSVSDDFGVEPNAEPVSGLGEWWAGLRDAGIADRLDRPRNWGWTVARWRLPGLLVWRQLLLAFGFVLVLMVGCAWITGQVAVAWLIMLAASSVMLFAPFGPWRWRRQMMSVELLRPVARAAFCRQWALAMAWDMAVWLAVVLALGIVTDAALVLTDRWFNAETASNWWRLLVMLGLHAALVSGLAVLLLGLGLLTLRVRYWLPVVLGLYLTWTLGLFIAMGWFVAEYQQVLANMALVPLGFAALSGVVGWGLSWLAYRRWLASEFS